MSMHCKYFFANSHLHREEKQMSQWLCFPWPSIQTSCNYNVCTWNPMSWTIHLRTHMRFWWTIHTHLEYVSYTFVVPWAKVQMTSLCTDPGKQTQYLTVFLVWLHNTRAGWSVQRYLPLIKCSHYKCNFQLTHLLKDSWILSFFMPSAA